MQNEAVVPQALAVTDAYEGDLVARAKERSQDAWDELYTRHYRNEFPQRFHGEIDTRRWGPGERIVFEPYTREVFDDSFRWIREHKIFEPDAMGAGKYEDACVTLAT